ncbi:hypothetical protein AOL_s00004g586 [Orbilia oligospora ATCC 24927]|uniref:Bifunctional lycopene cyclase/phytoene synthase n=2 Tax=Orbilia oligospora TaxID=2813651 RepID=G1WZ75_ARTOA|nr:hypothetical protein AOL_s00004g586 [Orbilia oligospora ATCC 24927]EGX53927.1 hypothetical protein AOL_s00004g586 [Orbilia oligospora ATCC 24927]
MAGLEYAFVHAKYTIPVAILLTVLLQPFKTSVDNYKITYLLIIAITAATPWDSYLLTNKVWTYPEHAIIGITLWKIPFEEYFFFAVQTYITSLICILAGKSIIPTAFLPTLPITPSSPSIEEANLKLQKKKHLVQNDYKRLRRIGLFGAIFIASLITIGVKLVQSGGQVPRKNVLIPILLPTGYLWFVDSLALKKGTWVINPEKSFGIKLWKYLDIEEALFFLMSNILITFGQLAFDHTLAVINGFPEIFNFAIPSWPSLFIMIRGLGISVRNYTPRRVSNLRDAILKLQNKSRSFSLASSVFEGRLRIDLVLLYAFCRNADDLIDEAENREEAQKALVKLSDALSNTFSYRRSEKSTFKIQNKLKPPISMLYNLPEEMASSLEMLPIEALPIKPIQGLLEGFGMDLQFPSSDEKENKTMPGGEFPIKTESDLKRYGYCVAGTVAELLLHLVFHHSPTKNIAKKERAEIIQAGVNMGIALQYINISRDIAKDALIGRCYIPSDWLAEYNLTPAMVVENPDRPEVRILRRRLLRNAMEIYYQNRGAIEKLPTHGGARKGVRGAVENYVEIGRVLLERDGEMPIRNDETVSKSRRLWVFVKALCA